MFLGPLCYGYALNCHLVYLAIPGKRPLCMKKQNLLVLIYVTEKSEIQICSNKHKTCLVCHLFHCKDLSLHVLDKILSDH